MKLTLQLIQHSLTILLLPIYKQFTDWRDGRILFKFLSKTIFDVQLGEKRLKLKLEKTETKH